MPSQRQPNPTFFVVISFCFNQVHQSSGNFDVVKLMLYTEGSHCVIDSKGKRDIQSIFKDLNVELVEIIEIPKAITSSFSESDTTLSSNCEYRLCYIAIVIINHIWFGLFCQARISEGYSAPPSIPLTPFLFSC